MALTKRKSRRTDDDDEIEAPVPAEPVVKERRPETMHDREQLGLEVASDLTLGGLATFLSVTTRGMNLIACNPSATAFVAVRVVVDEDGSRLELKPDDAQALTKADGIVAFLLGPDDSRTRYYLPVADFLGRAEEREGRLVVVVEGNEKWLRPFEGHPGVKRTFARLLP